MAEFQSFAKEEGFAPSDVPSITPYINENLEALRQSEKQNVQDQYVVDKERASELGKSFQALSQFCLLYTSPSPRDLSTSRMPSSA